jgi:hypothetical protein
MIVATFRGGVPLWIPDWIGAWILAREERRSRAAAAEFNRRYPFTPAPRRVVCPSCRVPFTRHGAASSSHFYRTREENDTCIVCREALDPVTLEPLAGGKVNP